jgi:hypothetical protein
MYEFRPATREDAAIIAVQRHRMFLAMNHADDEHLRQAIGHFLPWVREAITRGTYLGHLATIGHEVAAGAGMLVQDWPPGPRDPPAPTRNAGTSSTSLQNPYTANAVWPGNWCV